MTMHDIFYFRGGSESSMPKNRTAKDVIDYEVKELGNALEVSLYIDLAIIPAQNLSWVTKSESTARRYGTVSKFQIGNHRIIAKDGMGGFLIEKMYNTVA